MNSLLTVENATVQFGGILAVDNLNLEVKQGETVSLIGPNGAGKTTAFNLITGVYPPTNGRVLLRDAPVIERHPLRRERKKYRGQNPGLYSRTRTPTPDYITRLGVARTFQNIRLWNSQTVFDNLLTAQHCRTNAGLAAAVCGLNRREEAQRRQECEVLLETLGLRDVRDYPAASLPYGQQRRVEIARALATRPELLLLDEPAAGMNPQETEELASFLTKIKAEFGLTVLLIEHHMDLVMTLSDRIYVLNFGKLIAEGTPAEIQSDAGVVNAYLGGTADADD